MGEVGTERHCVVDGAIIHSCGRMREMGDKILRICDGVDTDVGPVCVLCLDFYNGVLDVVRSEFPDASPSTIRKTVRERIGDVDLLMQVRRENAKNVVLNVIGGWGELLSEGQIVRLKNFFLRGICLSDYDDGGLCGGSILPLRRALGCLVDVERTNVFLNALSSSLGKLEEMKDEIEVVDAGCGPVPLFGIMAAIRSQTVKKVTCLEANPCSAKMAKQIVSNLGLSDIIEVVNCDATKYKHDGGEVDLLISETMFSGLVNEPLVHILNNLASQVAEEGEIIPSEIVVNAGLIRADFVGSRLTEFEIAPVPVFTYVAGDGCEQIEFSFSVGNLPEGEYRLVLSADVELCDGFVLPSSIRTEVTCPHRVGEVFDFEGGDGVCVFVSYKPGDDCGDVRVEVR